MIRSDLERLSKDELIELVLKLQHPAKTSRTSSKPPSMDRKERREQSRPGGAKPGHEGHRRGIAEDSDEVVDHRPSCCPDCGLTLSAELEAETVSNGRRSRTRRLWGISRNRAPTAPPNSAASARRTRRVLVPDR